MNISFSGQPRRKLALSKGGQLYPFTKFYGRRKWEVLIEYRLTLEALEMCSLLCRQLSCLGITVGSQVQVFTEHWNSSQWSGERQSLGVWIKCICKALSSSILLSIIPNRIQNAVRHLHSSTVSPEPQADDCCGPLSHKAILKTDVKTLEMFIGYFLSNWSLKDFIQN